MLFFPFTTLLQFDCFLLLLAVPMLGHVGDGNIHCVFLIDPRSEQAYELTEHYSQAIGE